MNSAKICCILGMILYSRAQMSESAPKGKRTTISLTDVVNGMADEMMKDDGYDNFSAYVAELIRRDYKSARRKPKGELSSNVSAAVAQKVDEVGRLVEGEATKPTSQKELPLAAAAAETKKKRADTNPRRARKPKK